MGDTERNKQLIKTNFLAVVKETKLEDKVTPKEIDVREEILKTYEEYKHEFLIEK